MAGMDLTYFNILQLQFKNENETFTFNEVNFNKLMYFCK